MLEQFKKKFFFGYKNKRSKFEVEKVAIWQYFSISLAYTFLIFLFYPFQIKNYIITGLVSNFLMHHVTGWHLLCRKEITISVAIRKYLSGNNTVSDYSNILSIYSFIHTYIIGHYNPSVRIIDLVSHTTYVVCVNFIHKWRNLQF